MVWEQSDARAVVDTHPVGARGEHDVALASAPSTLGLAVLGAEVLQALDLSDARPGLAAPGLDVPPVPA